MNSTPAETELIAFFNRFEIRMPENAVLDCAHSGACDSDVAYWAPRLRKLNGGQISSDAIRAELREYGAWEDSELEDDSTNWERIVWIAAGNLKEERAHS